MQLLYSRLLMNMPPRQCLLPSLCGECFPGCLLPALRRVHWYWFRFRHTQVWIWALCWVDVLWHREPPLAALT